MAKKRFGGPQPTGVAAPQGDGRTRFVPNKAGIANMEIAIERGAEEFANRLADRARELAPVASVDGGTLRDSIRMDTLEEHGGKVFVVVAETRYAMYVEIGTADTPPQPFLNPALDQLLPEFMPAIRREIANG